MAFLRSALKRAENFLESVDESVAEASRRLALESAELNAIPDLDEEEEEQDGEYSRRNYRTKASNVRDADAEDSANTPTKRKSAASRKQKRSATTTSSTHTAPSKTEVPLADSEGSVLGARTSSEASKDPNAEQDVETPAKTVENELSEDTIAADAEGPVEGDEREDVGPDGAKIAVERDLSVEVPAEADPSSRVIEDVPRSQSASEASEMPKKEPDPTNHQESGIAENDIKHLDGDHDREETEETGGQAESYGETQEHGKHEPEQTPSEEDAQGLSDREMDQEELHDFEEELLDLRGALEHVEEELYHVKEEKQSLAKNLRSAKLIIEDLEIDRKNRLLEVRELRDALDNEQNNSRDTSVSLASSLDALKAELDAMRRQRDESEKKLESKTAEFNSREAFLTEENERTRQLLAEERERDISNADEARGEAALARDALEREVMAHAETNHRAKLREEQLELLSTSTANALALADRRAEEDRKAASDAVRRAAELDAQCARLRRERDDAIRAAQTAEETKQRFDEASATLESNFGTIAALEEKTGRLEEQLASKDRLLKELTAEAERLQSLERKRHYRKLNPDGEDEDQESTIDELRLQLRKMADATLRKQSQLELLRGENRALQHQLDAERQRARDAQTMAASATRALHGTAVDLERGPRRSSASSHEGAVQKLKLSQRLPKWLASTLRALDRASAATLHVLRTEPLIRIAFVLYVISMHFLVYLLLHFNNHSHAAAAPAHSVFGATSGG